MKIVRFVRRLIFSIWGLPWLGLVTLVMSSAIALSGLLGAKQESLHALGRLYGRLCLKGLFIRLKVNGREHLVPGASYVFAANHSSWLDIMILLAELPDNFRWMAKSTLFKVPIFGQALTQAGYIKVDRSNRRAAVKSISEACKRIEQGASVTLFPEGTRTPEGTLGHFQSAGLVLAIRTERPVVPLAIKGAGAFLPRGSFLLSPGPISLSIGPPIPTTGMELGDRHPLALRLEAEVGGMLGIEAHDSGHGRPEQ